jgi:hypothetical protein
MILPASDAVFSARNFDVLPMAGAVLGKRVIGNILNLGDMLGIPRPTHKLLFKPIYLRVD